MVINFDQLEKIITAIHASPQMVVINFAGAGAQALTWLHRVGGSSRTILEAADHYAATSLIDTIGFEPEQFTSPQVARAMATQAYIRAGHLAAPGLPIAGIGCTATIATDRVKLGEHRCCLAVCNGQGITTYAFTLTKGDRTRQEEENLVSLLILKAVADVCGVAGLPSLDLFETEALIEDFEPVDWLARLLAGEINWVAVSADGRIRPGQVWPNIAFLSGAFNPLHQGHQQLAQVASKILGREVFFELPLVNAEKAPLDLEEARRRAAQFAGVDTVLLTRAPLFSQKAQIFPHSVFILGIDTVERLWQSRFYHHDPVEMYAAFNVLRMAGCRFLVAGRLQDHHFLTLPDIKIPAGYQDLFEQIPEEKFRADVSSTLIREDRGES